MDATDDDVQLCLWQFSHIVSTGTTSFAKDSPTTGGTTTGGTTTGGTTTGGTTTGGTTTGIVTTGGVTTGGVTTGGITLDVSAGLLILIGLEEGSFNVIFSQALNIARAHAKLKIVFLILFDFRLLKYL